ncbi:hypothetical protein GQR58_029473 [Nymphon striatum]|nr:hypothetical protein GQR58_029473 [Nymphon striatum]KAG1648893.1 hypothetical protein GQR58_029473 [Nymphon striatum]KAG1648894.1 hypothetical protein GQR58_029473 [Nymphon striatum]KAG1648895.1 hypothetical protein GQR58_029473 [Nymphon striatum]KAG1648896.1 hypothetical protein GQR58_029473 [Nymphon striatum]
MNDMENTFGGKHLRLFVIIYPATKDLNKRWFALASKLFIINGGSKLETLGELIPALNEINNIIGTNEKHYIKRYFNNCELKVPEHLSKILFFSGTPNPNKLTISYSNHTNSTRETLTYGSSMSGYPYLEYKFEKTHLLGQRLSINSNNTLMIFCYDKNKNITFTGWSDNDQRLLGEPMTIFAALTVNYQPIINVKTRAVLQEYVNESYISSSIVSLVDDGSTEPDLTAQDGIYSGHVIKDIQENKIISISLKIGYVAQQNACIASNRT